MSLRKVVAIAGVIAMILTFYIAYRASVSDRQLFKISILALFSGLLFESFRISDKWRTVIEVFIISYLFSMICFLPGKHEHIYNFENHIEKWPYFFIVIFALAFGGILKDRITAKLTEGITLLLSISLIYWAVDYGFTNYNNWFSVSILIIVLAFSFFSVLNALTSITLTRTIRLTLSIWSSIILFAFALDNIISVFSNPDIESSNYLADGLTIGLQYFLLGVSAVYIMQNFMMLAAFMPSKGNTREQHKRDLKEHKEEHIHRYSDQQARIGYSLFCILFVGSFYWLNHVYQLLPAHTAIWLVFFISPLVSKLVELMNRRKLANKN